MKLLKVFLLDKRSLLMKSFPFLMTGITKLCTQTQLHPPLPSSIHLHPAPSTSTQLISTSTQLHPPPPSSFQSPPSSLQHPQQYLNQDIARNWAIYPNLDQKIKSCLFCLKIGTQIVSTMLIFVPTLVFSVSNPKSFFGQIWIEKFKVVHFD